METFSLSLCSDHQPARVFAEISPQPQACLCTPPDYPPTCQHIPHPSSSVSLPTHGFACCSLPLFSLFSQAYVFAPGPPESNLPPPMTTSSHVGPGKSKHSTPQFGALHVHLARMNVAPSWSFLSSLTEVELFFFHLQIRVDSRI